MHRNPETLTTFFSSGTKCLLTSWLLLFRHEERETQFLLCWLFLHRSLVNPQLNCPAQSPISTHWPNKRAAHPVDPSWTALTQVQISTNVFIKNHQNSQSIASGHDVIHTPVPFTIWGFYYDICDCHILRARAWIPALIAEQFKA